MCMIAFMAKRVRMIFDTDEEVRLAIKLAAMKAGEKTSPYLTSLLRKILAHEIEDAKRYVPKARPLEKK